MIILKSQRKFRSRLELKIKYICLRDALVLRVHARLILFVGLLLTRLNW